jgi:hypothetical protein
MVQEDVGSGENGGGKRNFTFVIYIEKLEH